MDLNDAQKRKKNCCAKGEGVVDPNCHVTRLLEKIRLIFKNVNFGQAHSAQNCGFRGRAQSYRSKSGEYVTILR